MVLKIVLEMIKILALVLGCAFTKATIGSLEYSGDIFTSIVVLATIVLMAHD